MSCRAVHWSVNVPALRSAAPCAPKPKRNETDLAEVSQLIDRLPKSRGDSVGLDICDLVHPAHVTQGKPGKVGGICGG